MIATFNWIILKYYLSIGPICHTHINNQDEKRISKNINWPSQGKFNSKFKQKIMKIKNKEKCYECENYKDGWRIDRFNSKPKTWNKKIKVKTQNLSKKHKLCKD